MIEFKLEKDVRELSGYAGYKILVEIKYLQYSPEGKLIITLGLTDIGKQTLEIYRTLKEHGRQEASDQTQETLPRSSLDPREQAGGQA